MYGHKNIQLFSKKGDGSITFRRLSENLFYVSLSVILALLSRSSAISKKGQEEEEEERKEIVPIVENDLSSQQKINESEEIIKELRPYDIQEPDF
ncbi:MAG TPA: hypothetical protein VE619_08265 [Nitrososphaeraceae archaeon]|nr:hypothetical protein [Nitrososphaeraceae archaeon]